jgi:nucleotide-binding universal stress UspA family protein
MTVLLCFDGSPSAEHAIRVAARTLSSGPVTLLHVWSPPAGFLPDAFGTSSAPTPTVAQLERFSVDRANEIGEQGMALARSVGLDTALRLERERSSVWETISAVADELDAELVALGTHGTRVIESRLLGSVSHAVVNHSRRPVLVVPAADR